MPPALPGFARRDAGRVVFGDAPVTLNLTLERLRSADGHAVAAFVRVGVRAVDRPADVQLFAEQFLNGRDRATADDIRGHLQSALAAAASEWAAAHDAAAIDAPGELDKALRKRAEAVAFGCGLEVVLPWAVTADSPSLRRQREDEQARRDDLARAEHAAKLAEKLASVGPAHRLPADEQASLLRTILAARPPAGLLVAAGPNLLVLGPDEHRKIAAPAEIGPVRSVRRLQDGAIALGGTSGVAVLDRQFAVRRVLRGVGGASARGFNAVARVGDGERVVASHGEIGLAVWDNDGPPRVVATAGPARHLVNAGGTLWLAAGDAAGTFDGDAIRPVADAAAKVVALLPVGEAVVVVRADGTLQSFDAGGDRLIHSAKLPGPVVAATALDAGGLRAVAVADDRGDLDAVTLDGRPLGRLAARVGVVRMMAFDGNAIAVVTGDRTAVLAFVTGSNAPRSRVGVLAGWGSHVTDLVEHRSVERST